MTKETENKDYQEIQLFVPFPVPSCQIKAIHWNDILQSWQYEYHAKIKGTFPKKATDPSLYVYGHIQELYIVDNVTKGSINIEVRSVDDIYYLLYAQAAADNTYRINWSNKNPDYADNVLKVELENKTQVPEYKHLIQVLYKDKEKTTFIVAPESNSWQK